MALGKIQVVLDLDSKDFQMKLMRAGQQVQSFAQRADKSAASIGRMERALTSARTAVRDFAITAASIRGAMTTLRQVTLDWVVGIGNASGKIERLGVLMEGFSTATTAQARAIEAATNVDFMVDMAKRVPFTLDELTNSFAKFKSVGIDPTNGSMDSLTDAIARFGGSDDQLHRASVAIQQMAGKGVISMEELRQQLGEAVPTALATMARSMNLTVAELTYKVGLGQVAAGTALQKFFVQLKLENEGASKTMMDTWFGLFSRLKTGWMLFSTEIGNSGFYERIKDALQGLVDTMSGVDGQRMAHNIGTALTSIANAIAATTTMIIQNWDKIVTAAKFIALVGAAKLLQNAIVWTMTVVLNLAGAYAKLSAAIAITNMMQAIAARTTMATGTAAAASTVALTGLAAVMRAVGVAVAVMTGPIGWLVTGVAALGAYFYSTAGSADKLTKSILETKGAMANAEEVDELSDRLKALNVQIFNARQDIKNHEGYWGESDEKGKVRLGELLKQRVDTQQAHALATAAIEKRASDEYIALKAIELDKALENHRVQFMNDQELTTKRLADLSEVEREEAKSADLRKKFTAEILEVERELQKAKTEDDGSKPHAAWILELRARLHTLKVDAVEVDRILAKMKNDFNESNKQKQAQKEAPFRNLIDQLTEDIAKLKFVAGNAGSTGLLGEIEAKIDAIARKSKLALPDIEAFKQSIRALAEEQAQLESEAKQKTFTQKLDAELARLGARIDGTSKKVAKLREEFLNGAAGELSRMTPELKQAYEAMLNLIEAEEKLGDKIVKARAVEEQMIKDTLQLQDDSLTGRERLLATYDIQLQKVAEVLDLEGVSDEEAKRRLAAFAAYKRALDEKMARDLETPMQKMNKQWQDWLTGLQSAITSWANQATDAFLNFAETGKFAFSDLINSILSDLLRLAIQKSIMGPLFEGLSLFMDGMFSGGANSGSAFGPQADGFTYMEPTNSRNGNVMTSYGPLSLERFSKGGVADRPMLSLFGEGALPEAYVPLPDGRSIPVTLEGGQGESPNMNVQVNIINESGTPLAAEEQGRRFDGERMVLDIVAKAASRPGAFRDSLRGSVTR